MYYLIFWISVVFFVAIVGAMLYFAMKYKRRPGLVSKPPGHATALEITWTVAPLFLLVYLFHAGFTTYIHGTVAPENAHDIRVRAMQWNWEFEHPNGTTQMNEAMLPVGVPIQFIISSSDVLHSFYVPEARLKRDAVPGLYTTLWFEVPKERLQGKKDVDVWVFCAEYCGAPHGITNGSEANTNHSTMRAQLHFVPQSVYDDFLKKGPPPPPECEGKPNVASCWGEQIYEQAGCRACHHTDGVTEQPGPNWKGLFGHNVKFEDGTSQVADANYIRQSILQPQAKIVAGYTTINMPPYRLSDREIDAVVAYIKSLGEQ